MSQESFTTVSISEPDLGLAADTSLSHCCAQSAGPIVAPDEAAKSGADAGKPGFVDRIYLDTPQTLQVKLKVL